MNFSFDVLAQISGGINMFSQTEAKLASYILENPERVLGLSISSLAEDCGVSIATVSRFCRRLSLNGYQEFRLELMKTISNSQDTVARVADELSPSDNINDVMEKVCIIHQNALQRSKLALVAEDIIEASDIIDMSKEVHFFGCGSMNLMAMIAKLQFMQVSTKFRCEIDPTIQALSISLLDERSVIVIFSYSGATRDVMEIATMAKERGVKIICVTRYTNSMLVELSDVKLICGVSEGPSQLGSVAVQAGMLYIIDVLYTEYCRRNADVAQINKEITSAATIGRVITKGKSIIV